jgi:hypothetical protein
MAAVVIGAPAPQILADGLEIQRSGADLMGTVVQAGATLTKDVEARRARTRLDSAAARVAFVDVLAKRTVERTSRYLGVQPVASAAEADYLLEVRLEDYGIDARGTTPAALFTNAEAVLLDRRSGHEIWSVKVRGTDQLTPRVRGAGGVAGAIVAAGALRTMSVADFQDALDQLASLTAGTTAGELRAALREVRK